MLVAAIAVATAVALFLLLATLLRALVSAPRAVGDYLGARRRDRGYKALSRGMVAVGAGARNEKGELALLDVKVGDRILFGKWSGTEVKIDGDDLLIMKESDIMGIIG